MWTKEDAKRVNKINSFYIPHQKIDNAIKVIEQSILLSAGSKEPQNVVLFGDAGTGKTTTCNAIVLKRPRKNIIKEGKEVTKVPAFYCSVPSPVTIKTIASAMLDSLGDPKPTIGVANDLTLRLGKLLKECETEVILLDELQHLLLKQGATVALDVKNWLKTLINQYKIPIIVVGTPDCNDVIKSCSQLSRRFTKRCELKNLSFGHNKTSEYRRFINVIEELFIQEINFKVFPNFGSRNNALAVYISTGGNPSDTIQLYKHAALNALSEKRESVKLDDFAEAVDSLVLHGFIKKFKGNPFRYSEAELDEAYSLI